MNKKYILLVVALLISLIVLSSCGNRQVGIDTNQTFTSALINLGGEWRTINVKSWRDFDNGDEVQIITTNGDVYLTHYVNVILVNKK